MFGRASDLTRVRKQNVSVDAGGVLFLRFIRMKTCEEQGLSIFPDADFATCPIYALALALITQAAPSADLLDHLPAYQHGAASTLGAVARASDTPLLELLDDPSSAASAVSSTAAATIASAPTIHNHVNRLLERIAKPAGIAETLTSHSFRRGGAQHTNGSEQLTARWIFDRGAWNVSPTNKAFNYVFNTRSEDHKVAKVLSGHDSKQRVRLADLTAFDAHTLEKIVSVQALLFSTCRSLGAAKYNVSQRVLDVFASYLIAHYPLLKAASPNGPATKRLETCVLEAGFSLADLLAWSTHLLAAQDSYADEKGREPAVAQTAETKERRIIKNQASVIDRLIDLAKRQDERLDAIEAMMSDSTRSTKKTQRSEEDELCEPSKRTKSRKQTLVTHLRSVRFEWYAKEPRLWSALGEKQKKSDSKFIVSFMKLFADKGFTLDLDTSSYRDDVMAVGLESEASLYAFLDARAITSRGANAVLKHMRVLHRAGELNELIIRHQRLLAAGAICDPAPPHTHNIVEPIARKKP